MVRGRGQLGVVGCAIPSATKLCLRDIHPLMAIIYDNDLGRAALKRFNQLREIAIDQDCSYAQITVCARGTLFDNAIFSNDWAGDQPKFDRLQIG